MKRYLKVFISLFLLFCVCTIGVFAQTSSEEDDDSSIISSWYLCKISGKNKAGKVIRGPFSDKQTVIANWIYMDCEPKGNICIAKHKDFVTNNPEVFYRKDFEAVTHDFAFDRTMAIEKYQIVIDSKIEKAYAKKIKKGGVDVANSGTVKEKVKIGRKALQSKDEIKYDESDDKFENEQEPIPEPTPEPEPDPEPVEEPEPEPVPEPQPEPEPENETLTVLDSLFAEVSQNQVQRYEKEYLQDYILPEEIPEPKDLDSEYQMIENPDETDIFGQTLLMKAAKAGNDWQVKTLLDAGADVNLQDKDGWTALMYAVRYQEGVNCIDLLINSKADLKIKNNYGLSALVIASCYNNNPQLIQKLLNFYSISDKEVLKSFALFLSTKQNSEYIQVAKLNVFLDKSIPLNNFYEGKTPLMYAAQFGNSTKILKLLIDNGATTSMRSTEGKTAFDYASENSSLKHDDIYWSLNRK